MSNIKRISIIAFMLLLVGVIGSISTFKSLGKSDQVAEEKVINNDRFTNIKITTDNARIEILPTKDSATTVEMSGTAPKNKKYSLNADVEGTTLSIQLKERHKKLINFDFFATALTLTVHVPEKQYDLIKVKSNNGRVNAENLHANDIDAETNNGRIELKNSKASTVKIEADNGRIEVKNVVASTVVVKANNGKILLNDVEGKIAGKTNNGSITLVTNHLDRPIEFETDNGHINIQTDKEPTNVTFDVNVHNGRVDIFGESSRNTVIGNGEHLIKLSSHNGRITVSK